MLLTAPGGLDIAGLTLDIQQTAVTHYELTTQNVTVGSTVTPTLVLSGDRDSIVPVQNSVNLAKRIPGAILRTVHGGSHTFFIEKPGEFNSEVIEFIAGIKQVTEFEPSCHMQE